MRLLSIQYLRGIAALSIVFYHLFVQFYRLGYNGPAPYFLAAGVDIFFVISGFIMWYTTFNQTVGTLEFYKHRFVRIVPLYWFITTFYLIMLIIKPSWMQSAKFNLPHILASYLFIPMVHPTASQSMWPLVVPGWTLNYEIFFYLLFGLALLFTNRARVAIIVAMLVCIAGLQVLSPPQNSIIGFYSSSIILEFALGVILGYLFTIGTSIPRLSSTIMVLAGFLGLLAISFFGISDSHRVVTFGIPALLIVAGAVFFERAHIVPEFAFPKLLGDASYSLYLSHGAVLSAIGQFWRYLGFTNASQPLCFISFSLTGVIVATVVGISLYQLVERPLLHKLSGRIKRMECKSYRRLPAG